MHRQARSPAVPTAAAFLVVAGCFAAPRTVSAQVIRGVVSEEATYEPIDGATVTLVDVRADTVARAITDEGGYFSLRARGAGDYYVIASALGYRPVQSDAVHVEAEDVRVVELDMAPQPIPLGGLLVETEGREPEIPGLAGTGFYDRLARGWGEFMTPGEVAAHPGEYTHQLFRAMQRVELVRTTEGPTSPFTDELKMRINEDRDLCDPLLYIDGIRTELMPGESLHDAAPRDRVEAIEVHTPPFGAPMRYLPAFSPGACGVVLIWMR